MSRSRRRVKWERQRRKREREAKRKQALRLLRGRAAWGQVEEDELTQMVRVWIPKIPRQAPEERDDP